jgi:hypothetical protein
VSDTYVDLTEQARVQLRRGLHVQLTRHLHHPHTGYRLIDHHVKCFRAKTSR